MIVDAPKIKICGLTTAPEAVVVACAGADWIGLNFHPPSPRFLDLERAAEIMAILPAGVEAVGLFVDRTPAEIRGVAYRLGLQIVQLHGEEPPEDLDRLRGLRVVRAFRIRDEAAIDAMTAYLDRAKALGAEPEAVLVDAYAAGVPGGTGRSIADELLDRLPPLPRLVLAGGLTAENVADRVRRVRPWMVDTAGGVEVSPGRKDPERVAAFIRAVRTSVTQL